MIRSFLLSLSAVALASTAQAQGPNINVDFTGLGYANSGTPAATFGGAPGPAAAGGWNEVDVDLQVGGQLMTGPLLDTTGANSGATLSLDGGGFDAFTIQADEPNTFGDDEALMDDGFYFDGPGTITINGLPAGTYTVFTYAMAPDDATFETSVDVTGGTGPQTVGGDFSAGYAQGTTHAMHVVTIGAGMPLVILTDVVTSFDTINGLQIVGGGTGGNIGTNYCMANPNSSGGPGVMSAQGSRVASVNNLMLTASSLPPNQFGIFVSSTVQAFVPNAGGTSNGNICLGGQIVRFNRAGEILPSGTMGTFSLQVDLTNIPLGNGIVSVMAGETWNYQAWVRDTVGQGSNFTDGLELLFL